jgi:alkaline phosphatase
LAGHSYCRLIFGGGREYFLSTDDNDPEYPDKKGKRIDGMNLIRVWENKFKDARFVWNKEGFDAIDHRTTTKVLGLFEPSHMQFELNRNEDKGGEPSLSEMTSKAIKILKKNKNGFFLLVEGGRIDHAHHDGRAALALNDGIALANAVQTADALTDDEDTLIVVTADHSHVFTIAGHSTRGNPILGNVMGNDLSGNPETTPTLADDGKPYTTLGYHNGPGSILIKGDKSGGRPDTSLEDTRDKNYRQQALVPLSKMETHGGEDVAIYAKGPGAQSINGVMEQNKIFNVISDLKGIAN